MEKKVCLRACIYTKYIYEGILFSFYRHADVVCGADVGMPRKVEISIRIICTKAWRPYVESAAIYSSCMKLWRLE